MSGHVSQAEKWRQWKQKMHGNDANKQQNVVANTNNVSDKCTRVSIVGTGGSTTIGGQGVTAPERVVASDRTLHSVHEFIKQCKASSGSINIETVGGRGNTSASRDPTSLNTIFGSVPDKDKPAEKLARDPRSTPIDNALNISDFKVRRNFCDNESTDAPNKISDNDETRVKRSENRPTNEDISVEKNESINNTSVGKPAKRPCNASISHNEKLNKTNAENKVRRKKGIEKSGRTVRFAENPRSKTNKEEPPSKKSTKKHGDMSVVDALKIEGRRLMVDYLAEYGSSSESSGDEEVVHASGINHIHTRQPEEIRFTVHLSTSMKEIKAYRCVMFDVIETNEGKAYSATTGRFLAPQKGSYVFFLTTTSSIEENPEVSIIHNFHPVDPTKVKTNKQHDGKMQTKTDAVLLFLERNDEIWLLNVTRLSNAQKLRNCHFLSFSGCMLKM